MTTALWKEKYQNATHAGLGQAHGYSINRFSPAFIVFASINADSNYCLLRITSPLKINIFDSWLLPINISKKEKKIAPDTETRISCCPWVQEMLKSAVMVWIHGTEIEEALTCPLVIFHPCHHVSHFSYSCTPSFPHASGHVLCSDGYHILYLNFLCLLFQAYFYFIAGISTNFLRPPPPAGLFWDIDSLIPQTFLCICDGPVQLHLEFLV